MYTWGFYEQNIAANQIITPGGTICVGAKFVGEPKKYFFSEWADGHKGMLEGLIGLIEEADAIVTYNGDKFDLPTLRGEYVLAGMPPPPPVASIDVYKTVKQFRFGLNKLDRIGRLLEIGQKVKHEGFPLWTAVMAGDPKAQRRMQRYCVQDVVLLEQLYNRLRPFIKNHPRLQETGDHTCAACGGTHLQKRGWSHSRASKAQRLVCTDCGHWQLGKRVKL